MSFIDPLKKLSGRDDGRSDLYKIVRYHHPSSDKSDFVVTSGLSLEEAKEHCSSDESSFREGPEEDWWFEGFVRQDSDSCHVTLW